MNKKIFVLGPHEVNPWHSCRFIEAAMASSLQSKGDDSIVWHDQSLSVEFVERIRVEASAVLVLSTLALNAHRKQLPLLGDVPLLIPIFGDLTIETILWEELVDSLKGRKVVLLAASTRQCQQIKALIKNAQVKLVPYPLQSSWFATAPVEATKAVKIVYAGRLTPQKNVLELMESFLQASRLNDDIVLEIAGTFDSRAYHFHGYTFDFEKYKTQFHDIIKASQGKIIFHDYLEQDELRQLFDQADMFVSMSTYHDEDFGLSAAQACARGLKLLLSDWGGHWDYEFQGLATLIPVQCDERNIPRPILNRLVKEFVAAKRTTQAEKNKQQKKLIHYLDRYAARIDVFVQQDIRPFEGATEVFRDYILRSQKEYVFSYRKGDLNKNLYHAIYDSYLSTVSSDLREYE